MFSRTLDKASWSNTKLVKGDMAAEIRKMKKERQRCFAIGGECLIDEYQIVVSPIVLGKGRTMFDGIKNKVALKPTKTRTFGKRECLAVLRAGGVKEEHNDHATPT